MAEIFGFEINSDMIWLVIAIVFIAAVIWIVFKHYQGGRSGEEKEEEKETDQLKKDEKTAEAAQKDEKKQCKILDGMFSDIMIALRNSGNSTLADQSLNERMRISKILKDEMGEKMSEETALQLFKELHALINIFLAKLPTDNRQINGLVEEIRKHQKRYYEDLILEITMTKSKKDKLRKLWKQVIDEEKGTGNADAV